MSDESDEYARLENFKYVASPGSRLVCVGEINGSYNYAFRDEVYPPSKRFIPVTNRFGGIDYLDNPNYRPERDT